MNANPQMAAQGWYVVIGINQYQADPAIKRLHNAVKDALAVAELLSTKYGYEPLCDPLLDTAANLDGLTRLLNRLEQAHHPDDSLFFYFAGHGTADDDPANPDPIGFLVPHDAVDVEDTQAARLLPMTAVRECLERLDFKKVLAVLDCCHAGGIGLDATRDTRRPRGVQFQEVYAEYHRQPTRQAISSATLSQKAKDSTRFGTLGRRGESDHSPFAAALLDVLRAEDADIWQWDVLTANELMYHISRRMREENQSQIPGLWTLDGNQVDYLFEPLGLSPQRAAEPDHNPYRGLLPYEAQDRDLFFGRDRERATLQEKIIAHCFVALVGRSGVGKSSLLRSGLIADLLGSADRGALLQKEDRPARRAAYPPAAGARTWAAVLLRPQAAPLTGLAQVLAELLGREVGADELAADESALKWVGDFAAAHPGCRLLLAIDQLEELILECKDEREAIRFLELLGRALEAQPGLVNVALAYRADYLKALKSLVDRTALASLWDGHTPVELREMDTHGLREVIEQPVRQRHLRFEAQGTKRLEDQVLEEVQGEPGALPLLSFTLSRLYEEWAAKWRGDHFTDRILTFDSYDALGGAAGALGKRADMVYHTLAGKDSRYERTAPNVMLRMVQIGGEGGARPMPEDELTYSNDAETARSWAFVNEMEVAGLLVVSGSEPNREVEPAHSALVQRWEQMQSWRGEAMAYLPLQRELAEAARKPRAERALWDKHPKLPQLAAELWGATPGGMLWPGPLAALRAFPPPRAGDWLSKVEAEFVEESVRVRAKSQLVWIVSLTIFVLGLLIATGIAWQLRGVAVTARATAVAERSTAVAATTAEATAHIFADERRIAAETAAAKEATARAAEGQERIKAELAATAEAQAKATAESRRVEAEREAQLALSRELAARSSLELAAGRLETAQLLAIQSGQITGTVQAFDAIRTSLAQPGRTVAISQVEKINCQAQRSFQRQPEELKVSYSSGGLSISPAGLVLQNTETGEKVTLRGYPRPTTFDLRAFQSPKGPYILLVGLGDNEARIWNSVADFQVALLLPATGPLTELAGAWSPSGQLVATSGCSVQTFPDKQCGLGGVWIWDAFSGSRQFTLTGHSNWVCDSRWLADDRLRTVSSDGTAREWVLTAGSELPSLSLEEGKAKTVAPSQFTCTLSDAQKRAAIRPFDSGYPRGRSLICIADRLWLTSFSGAVLVNGQTAGVVKMRDEVAVFDAQLSSDGQQIALAGCRGGREGLDPRLGIFCEEAKLQLLNARDGRLLAEVPVAGKVITRASWSGDGGHLLLAANDQEYAENRKPVNPRIVVIDTASRMEVYTIASTDKAPNRIAWSADNEKILVFGSEVVRQHFLNIQDLIEAACTQTPRNFTWDEWNRFMTGSYRPTCIGRPIPETAVQGIRDVAASEVRAGQTEFARQRLRELNTWLAQSQQIIALGVEVEQFINQTLKQQ